MQQTTDHARENNKQTSVKSLALERLCLKMNGVYNIWPKPKIKPKDILNT